MATRSEIEAAIIEVIAEEWSRDTTALRSKGTKAVLRRTAGVMMPDKRISPPFPELSTTITVSTATDAAYKTLGATYQRDVYFIADDDDEKVMPPRGGNYYSFSKFLKNAEKKDLSETGEIYMACVKGTDLYYQGIPSSSEDLLVYCYRLPVAMANDSSVPDGIPASFALDLIKDYVLGKYYGDLIGKDVKKDVKYPDKAFSKNRYHMNEFYKTMEEVIQFIGDHDEEPQYIDCDSEYSEDEYD